MTTSKSPLRPTPLTRPSPEASRRLRPGGAGQRARANAFHVGAPMAPLFLAALLALAACTAPTPPQPSAGGYTPLPPAGWDAEPKEPWNPGIPPAPPARPKPQPSSPTPRPTGSVTAVISTAGLPSLRINDTDYVDAAAFLARLGLRADAGPGGRGVVFQGGGHRVTLDAEERETTLDGLRVFLGEPARLRARVFYVSRTDAEKLLGPLLAPAGIPGPRRPPPRVIVLDPGHGGGDSGMENKLLKLNEKTYTLDVAQRLKPLLEARGFRVVLTRADDRELSRDKKTDLAARSALANRERADLFVSIHFNSAPQAGVTGTEVYWFPPPGQRSATSWAVGEKADDESAASPVNRFDAWSAVLAGDLHRALLGGLGTVDRGQKLKHLGVLRGLDCPGVLVECAFLSSEAEARKAATPAFRQKIAEGIATGLAAYAARLGAPSP